MTAATAEYAAAAQAGRTELGTITIVDSVVSKIAARAAAENPTPVLPQPGSWAGRYPPPATSACAAPTWPGCRRHR